MALSPFIFSCLGPSLSVQERRFFAESQPFGFILFSRNLETPAQIHQLCIELRAAVGWHAPVMIDQEGGRVSRLGAPHWFEFPPALDQAAAPQAERLFWLRGRLIAENLRSCGIDSNCAPLGDIAQADTHAVLKNRCYGSTLSAVVTHARALHQGLRHGGVSGVLKHIPGHGRGTLDSHLELPRVPTDRDSLERHDFEAFRQLNTIEMGMTAHLVFEDIDPNHPATHSPAMLDIIRKHIGFDGLLMTDDISMQALSGPLDVRAQRALSAGCDIILHCNGQIDEMQLLAGSTNGLSAPSQMRVARVLAQRPDVQPVDIQQVKAEFDALLGELR
jgi:beta-N-acetylhexosaminidase